MTRFSASTNRQPNRLPPLAWLRTTRGELYQ